MSTQPAARRWTYAEFARLPDDGNRYEVIGGELHVTPAPTTLHQKIVTRIARRLEEFAELHGLGEVFVGPVDVLFAEGDYLEPDLVFVRRERLDVVSDRGLEGAPDLVVEVLSPTTASRDRRLKRERYAHFGVPEYWIVDPVAKRIEVHGAAGDASRRTHLTHQTLDWQPVTGGPTLTIDVARLLRDVPPAPASHE
jgi:Uma2 family endonuclease